MANTQEYLGQLSQSEIQNMAKWGFLKNIINIDTFFASPETDEKRKTNAKF
jgi:hypothetical protein